MFSVSKGNLFDTFIIIMCFGKKRQNHQNLGNYEINRENKYRLINPKDQYNIPKYGMIQNKCMVQKNQKQEMADSV